MKMITNVFVIAILVAGFVQHFRINALEERIKFVCSLPIVANKSVLLMNQRDGKWVFDVDVEKSFYYVPSGC